MQFSYVTLDIELDKLPPNEQLKGRYDPRDIQEMVVSLSHFPQFHPIVIARFRDGTEIIKDGVKRIKAARVLNWKTIRADIYENADDIESLGLWSAVCNLARDQNDMAESDSIAGYLRENPGLTLNELAKTFGLPQARVNKLLGLQNLLPEIQDQIRSGHMSEGTAYQAAKLSVTIQKKLATDTQGQKKITGTDVKKSRSVQRNSAIMGVQFPTMQTLAVSKEEFVIYISNMGLFDNTIYNSLAEARSHMGTDCVIYKLVKIV